MAEFSIHGVPPRYGHGQLQSYAFRDKVSRQRIYVFWLAVVAQPTDDFRPVEAELRVSDLGIRKPILIDVRTGAVTPLQWEAHRTLRVPLKDSVMAVSDASYLNWPAVPETPWSLQANRTKKVIELRWKLYSKPVRPEIERSVNYGPWRVAGEITGEKTEFRDPRALDGHVTYRLRAFNKQGPSAWSNPAWVDTKRR